MFICFDRMFDCHRSHKATHTGFGHMDVCHGISYPQLWRQLICFTHCCAASHCHTIKTLTSLDGSVCVREVSPHFRLGHHSAADQYPVAAAWHWLVWTAAHEEVLTRFGTEHRLHVTPRQQGVPEMSFSMGEIYSCIFQGREHCTDPEQRRHILDGIHSAIHEKLPQSHSCSVCYGAILKNDARPTHESWAFNALCLLWDALVSTILQHGTGWSVWRSVPSTRDSSIEQRLPPKLQITDIPKDQIQKMPNGLFKWGDYKSLPDMNQEEAYAFLNKNWQEDRERRINILREGEAKKSQRPQNSPGDKLVLRQAKISKSYAGRVWRLVEQWVFQEDVTGIEVSAIVNPDLSIRHMHRECEGKLYRAMRTEYWKQRQTATKAARKAALNSDGPLTISDLGLKDRTPTGKFLYTWGNKDRGRVEVEVTPQRLRAPPQEGSSEFQCAASLESTPARALRKMKDKVRKIQTKAARGQHERIVAKAQRDAATPCEKSADIVDASANSPALQTLTDPLALQHVIEAFCYLSTLRLHYCSNCDEQWPVYDMKLWPQTGVPWCGPKAGKCETIERAGFYASWKDNTRCSRCDGNSAYSHMYSKANFQHLGPRHPALSALTWYESLLIARVHPVVSVITMTATGLLCYAGHVCNYYVKVMEWVHGLPAVLRDKKWFLIKRRRSIRAGETDTRVKKPTTANRYRLEAAIHEALHFMPSVYKGSSVLQEELNKFPREGEKEMMEQEDTVDLSGEVHLSKEVFTVWFGSVVTIGTPKPCAAIVRRYALDQQGVEFRGSVAADTAWELCGRLLSLKPEQDKISTRDIAQLLVYWLEEGQVPHQLGEKAYEGMMKEYEGKFTEFTTVDDELVLKCQWIKQAIHSELDSVREEWAAAGKDLPVNFEVCVA